MHCRFRVRRRRDGQEKRVYCTGRDRAVQRGGAGQGALHTAGCGWKSLIGAEGGIEGALGGRPGGRGIHGLVYCVRQGSGQL